jgi:hypothetical protein
MASNAYIPTMQPKLRKSAGGRPQTEVTTAFNKILMDSFWDQEGRYARVRTEVDREEIKALRSTLRLAARRLTEERGAELLDDPDRDELKVDLLVTNQRGEEIARGGARGKTDWLGKIPGDGKYVLWFRMHKPLVTGERARQRADALPGDALLLCAGSGWIGDGQPLSVRLGSPRVTTGSLEVLWQKVL